MICFCRTGTRCRGHLDAEIAPGHHDGVCGDHDLVDVLDRPGPFELGDQGDLTPGPFDLAANISDIRGGADIAGGEEVHTLCDRQSNIGTVLGRDLEWQNGVGKIDALAGRDGAADNHSRFDLVAALAQNLELDHTVTDEHPFTGSEVLQELGVPYRNIGSIPVVGENHLLSTSQGASPAGQLAQPVSRPHQIQHDGHMTA